MPACSPTIAMGSSSALTKPSERPDKSGLLRVMPSFLASLKPNNASIATNPAVTMSASVATSGSPKKNDAAAMMRSAATPVSTVLRRMKFFTNERTDIPSPPLSSLRGTDQTLFEKRPDEREDQKDEIHADKRD